MDTLSSFKLPYDDLQHIDCGLGANSEALCNSRVLITGASGFFGMLMLESLIWLNMTKSLNMEIHVVVRNTQIYKKRINSWIDSQIQIIEGDLSTLKFERCAYKYIIHLASEAIKMHDCGSFFSHMNKSVAAANNLINLAKECETDSILITTSGSDYGDYLNIYSPNFAFLENIQSSEDVFNEKAVYSETKRYLELLFSTATTSFNFKVKIARCFSFVGPYLPLNSNYAIGNFILDVIKGRNILINGDGKSLRSYLYTSDLIIYLLLILIKGRSNIPYNVGSSEFYSIRKIAELVQKYSAQKSSVHILNILSNSGAGNNYIPSIKNIKEDFDFNELITLEQAIIKTIEWNKIHYL
jgi:dTDP-glucose 4,6-dehydratase